MQAEVPTSPISIWVTGPTIPAAERRAGTFADMIRATVGAAWGGPWSVVDAVDEAVPLPEPDDVAGVIVTGSPARIAEQRPWMRRVQHALRRLVDAEVPVLGICFGHQLLGQALGGQSGPNPLGREIGTVELETLADGALLPPSRRIPVSMTHLDVVLSLPPGAQPLAATALDRYAAVRFGRRAWGVQFHPEFDAAVMRDYLAALRDALMSEGFDPDALVAACRDTPEAATILRRFAAHAARYVASGRASAAR